MFYNICANMILIVHFAFICFVLFGAFMILKWPWVIYLHFPAFIWGILIEAYGWICPLAPIEQWLRILAGESGFQTGFIEHYLLPIIYPSGLTRSIQIGFAVLVGLINVLIYAWLFFRRMKLNQNRVQ